MSFAGTFSFAPISGGTTIVDRSRSPSPAPSLSRPAHTQSQSQSQAQSSGTGTPPKDSPVLDGRSSPAPISVSSPTRTAHAQESGSMSPMKLGPPANFTQTSVRRRSINLSDLYLLSSIRKVASVKSPKNKDRDRETDEKESKFDKLREIDGKAGRSTKRLTPRDSDETSDTDADGSSAQTQSDTASKSSPSLVSLSLSPTPSGGVSVQIDVAQKQAQTPEKKGKRIGFGLDGDSLQLGTPELGTRKLDDTESRENGDLIGMRTPPRPRPLRSPDDEHGQSDSDDEVGLRVCGRFAHRYEYE